MISFLDPLTMGYTVTAFRNRALEIILDLKQRNKTPVIVGGTNYYMEAIIWKILVVICGFTTCLYDMYMYIKPFYHFSKLARAAVLIPNGVKLWHNDKWALLPELCFLCRVQKQWTLIRILKQSYFSDYPCPYSNSYTYVCRRPFLIGFIGFG